MSDLLIIPPNYYCKKDGKHKSKLLTQSYNDCQAEISIIETKLKKDWNLSCDILGDAESLYKIPYDKFVKKYLATYKQIILIVNTLQQDQFVKMIKNVIKTSKDHALLKSALIIVTLNKSFYYEFENSLCFEMFNFSGLADGDVNSEKIQELRVLIENRLSHQRDSGLASTTTSDPISIPSLSVPSASAASSAKSPSSLHRFLHNSVPARFSSLRRNHSNSTSNHSNQSTSELDTEHMTKSKASKSSSHFLTIPRSLGSLLRHKPSKKTPETIDNSGTTVPNLQASQSVSPRPKHRAKIINFRRALSPDCLQNQHNHSKSNKNLSSTDENITTTKVKETKKDKKVVSKALNEFATFSKQVVLETSRSTENNVTKSELDTEEEVNIKYYSWAGDLDETERKETENKQTKEESTDEVMKSVQEIIDTLEKNCEEIKLSMQQQQNNRGVKSSEKRNEAMIEKCSVVPLRIQRPLSESGSMDFEKMNELAQQIDNLSSGNLVRSNSQYDNREPWRFTRHPLIVTSFFATAAYTAPYWSNLLQTSPLILHNLTASMPQYVSGFFRHFMSIENIQQASLALFYSAFRNRID